MRRLFHILGALLLLLMVACAGVPQAALPTTTPLPSATLPPTVEPTNPPATPAPATATPAPPAARIFYTLFDDARLQAEIHSMATDGSDDKLLATCAGRCSIAAFDLSPDGRQLAYVTNHAQKPIALYLLDLTSGEEQLLEENSFSITLAGFSPDGSRLAYVLGEESEIFGVAGTIWVRGGDGAKRQVSERIHPLGRIFWLNASSLIFSESDALGQVGTTALLPIDPAGSPEPLVTGTLRALSPDRSLALIGTEAIGHDIAAEQRFAHQIVALDSTPPRTVQQFAWTAGAALWSPDGTHILHIGTTGLELLDVADGTLTLIERTSPKDSSFFSTVVWESDGQSLLYSATTSGATPQTEIRRRTLDGDEQLLTSFAGAYSIVLYMR